MLMLLCGFFRTWGQHLPHQMYLSFVALSQPALYSQWNLFSMNDKHEGSPKAVKGKQDAKWNIQSIWEEKGERVKKYTHCWCEKSWPQGRRTGAGAGKGAQHDRGGGLEGWRGKDCNFSWSWWDCRGTGVYSLQMYTDSENVKCKMQK